jgi:hypothetical protein
MNEPALIELPPPVPRNGEGEKNYSKRPKRRRQHVEQFRTDDDEHAALLELAHDAGLSVGAYYRRELLGNPGLRAKRRPPTENSRLKAQHITAINRVGNLVNQGIHSVHEIRLAAPVAVERDRLAYELEAVRKQLDTAFAALSEALNATAGGDVREG